MKITRQFGFDAAHRLTRDSNSPCFHLHGHRYECLLTFESSVLDDEEMVMNFHTVKGVFVSCLMECLDHGIILNPSDTSGIVELCKKNGWKVLFLIQGSSGLEPTVENLADWIRGYCQQIVKARFGDKFKVSVKLYETPNCSAESI